jgi:hypothetical protein
VIATCPFIAGWVGGVEWVEGLESEVVDDEQVDAQQLAHLEVVAVVEPAGPESLEQPVAAFEVDADAAADRGVAEGGGQSCPRRRDP